MAALSGSGVSGFADVPAAEGETLAGASTGSAIAAGADGAALPALAGTVADEPNPWAEMTAAFAA